MAELIQTLHGIKRGDTLVFNWSLPLEFAELIETIAVQVNDVDGKEIEDLTVTLLEDTSNDRNWRFKATPLQTAFWPVKTLRFDIKHIAFDGTVIRTDTVNLPVRRSETP